MTPSSLKQDKSVIEVAYDPIMVEGNQRSVFSLTDLEFIIEGTDPGTRNQSVTHFAVFLPRRGGSLISSDERIIGLRLRCSGPGGVDPDSIPLTTNYKAIALFICKLVDL